MQQSELFSPSGAWPEGFVYQADFLSAAWERELLRGIRALPFEHAPYHEWQARRRIVAFGGRYDFERRVVEAAPPLPQFLVPLRAAVAAWAGVAPAEFAQAMVTEYAPGTPLGWHRDAPQYEHVAGVSLMGHARLRLRPWPPQRNARATHAIELAPRSVYALRAAVRWAFQHAVSPTRELRYSVTFRTRRDEHHAATRPA